MKKLDLTGCVCVCWTGWDNPARWKAAAFIREADSKRAQLQKQQGGGGGGSARARAPALNIVSIGDALFERVASHAAARVWDLVKTVKLLDNPVRTNRPSPLPPSAEALLALFFLFLSLFTWALDLFSFYTRQELTSKCAT